MDRALHHRRLERLYLLGTLVVLVADLFDVLSGDHVLIVLGSAAHEAIVVTCEIMS
jgi:hypothetical protein